MIKQYKCKTNKLLNESLNIDNIKNYTKREIF